MATDIIVTKMVILVLVKMMRMSLIILVMDFNCVYLFIHSKKESYLPSIYQKLIFMDYFKMIISKTIGNT